jgi:hypothetical protein
MSDSSAPTGLVLYLATIIAVRYLAIASADSKNDRKLIRPKSFLLSEKKIILPLNDKPGYFYRQND